MKERKRGSVEILCREIDFAFTAGMETRRLLVTFVRQLVLVVAEDRWSREQIAEKLGTVPPSAGSGRMLDAVLDMLNGSDIDGMVAKCAHLHELAGELNPEDAYPTDHLVGMLSSCVSAIRFGCDTGKWGTGSRHAAEASNYVWEQHYGVKLHDRMTARWQKDWARHKFQEAILALALPPTVGGNDAPSPNPPEIPHDD